MRSAISGVVFALCVMCGGALWAQDRPQGPPPGPPPEAVEACEGQAAGAACAFEGRRGEAVEGKCFTPDESKPLACRPDRPAGPPPEQGGRGQRSKTR